MGKNIKIGQPLQEGLQSHKDRISFGIREAAQNLNCPLATNFAVGMD